MRDPGGIPKLLGPEGRFGEAELGVWTQEDGVLGGTWHEAAGLCLLASPIFAQHLTAQGISAPFGPQKHIRSLEKAILEPHH